MRRVLLATLLVTGVMAGALASHTAAGFFQVVCPNAGPFCIEGTIPDTGATGATDPNGNTKELGPAQGSSTKIGVINTATVPMLSLTNPNSSVDLNQVYLQTKRDATTADVWVYFAWLRDSVNGSGFVSLEADVAASDCDYTSDTTLLACNPWANRATGDFLFAWDQQGNSHDIYLRVFDGSGHFITPSTCPPADVTPLGCKLQATDAVAEYNSDFSGGELAINLTHLGIAPPGVCTTLANVIPGTVTGNSDTADYKDVVLKPLKITTCGSVTVEKVTQNAAGAVVTDTVSTFNFSLTGNGGSVSETHNIKSGAANIQTFNDLPSNTDYKLVENTAPSNYSLVSIVCDAKDLSKGATAFSVTDGNTTACVITNRQNPNIVTAGTVPHVALRDEMNVSNLLRVSGDDPTAFTVTFRLYDSVALCDADTARTGGTAFTRTLVLSTTDAGKAETHAEGSGVQKPAGEYAWWAKFSGNKVNNLDINLPKESGCSAEKTSISFPQ